MLHVLFPKIQDSYKIGLENFVCNTCSPLSGVRLKASQSFKSPYYCCLRHWILIYFLDVVRLRIFFREAELPLSQLHHMVFLKSIALVQTECARRRAARRWILFTVWFAYSVLLALARDSPERPGHEGSPRSMRKENIRNVSFILGASRVPAYWLAYNVRLNAVKLTQNYVQNSYEAQIRNSS